MKNLYFRIKNIYNINIIKINLKIIRFNYNKYLIKIKTKKLLKM